VALRLDHAIARSVRYLPRPVLHRVARRYIAGERLDDALATVRRLAASGSVATIDILGEHVTGRAQAEATREAYKEALTRLDAERLPSGISVKPTALGLAIDPDFCLANVEDLAARAAEHGRFLRVDMEESTYTGATLDLVQRLHRGHQNVGAVIQARLRRSGADVARLLPYGISVRLCKGIYEEPPAIAFQDFQEIRESYLRLLDPLLEAGCFVGIATHDPFLVDQALRLVRRHGLPDRDYEFQMLMGVAEPLRARLVAAGHRVRVYVPYGRDWFGYSMRRLQENPQMARQIAMSVLPRPRGTR
jgi:proline dehydrogenase